MVLLIGLLVLVLVGGIMRDGLVFAARRGIGY